MWPECKPGERPTRILVYGVTGSGKTTLAKRLSVAWNLPWHAVDDLTWEPGWVQVPLEEQRRRVAEICGRESWILDAAYAAWLDVPLARAQLIVALDYPRWVSLSRLVRRTLVRMVDRRPICNGNRESLKTALARNSIIAWHFKSFSSKRRRIAEWCSDPEGPSVIRLRRRRDAVILLAGFSSACQGPE